MQGNTHASGGALAGILTAAAIHAPLTGILLGAGLGILGGLLPDIDHPKSKITQKTGPIGFVCSRVFKHRGMLHTPFFWTVFEGILYILFRNYVPHLNFLIMELAAGELSHLILDSMNPVGIMWLYPFTKKRFRFMKIKTGTDGDKVTGMLCSIACAAIVVYLTVTGTPMV